MACILAVLDWCYSLLRHPACHNETVVYIGMAIQCRPKTIVGPGKSNVQLPISTHTLTPLPPPQFILIYSRLCTPTSFMFT